MEAGVATRGIHEVAEPFPGNGEHSGAFGLNLDQRIAYCRSEAQRLDDLWSWRQMRESDPCVMIRTVRWMLSQNCLYLELSFVAPVAIDIESTVSKDVVDLGRTRFVAARRQPGKLACTPWYHGDRWSIVVITMLWTCAFRDVLNRADQAPDSDRICVVDLSNRWL